MENKYTMLKSLVVDFSESLINYTWCCCNRYSQILFFHLKNGKICIFDVFHTSNNTFLTYDEKYPEIYFNETGEEIYVLYDQKVSINLYKSMFKTLLQQCAFVVAKTYTKCQLYNMKLPKRLYNHFMIVANPMKSCVSLIKFEICNNVDLLVILVLHRQI